MYTTDRTPAAQLCEMNPLYGPLHLKPPHVVISSSENHRDPPMNIDAALSYKSVHLQHSDKISELQYIMEGDPVYLLVCPVYVRPCVQTERYRS